MVGWELTQPKKQHTMKVIDFHCDVLYKARQAARKGTPLCFEKNDNQIDLQKLAKGDYLLQCFAAFVYMENNQDPLLYAMEEIDEFYRILNEYPDQIAQVKSWADLEANRAAGKISAMLTIEDGGCCQGSLAALRNFYRLGVRIMTLTWNFKNTLASPNTCTPGTDDPAIPNTTDGLTKLGIEFLHEMERLGIIIDVSHLSDAGIWDVYHNTTRPFIASHSSARSVCHHARNLSDEMIRAIAERGGVAGINYCAGFLTDTPAADGHYYGTAALIADHIDHMRNVGGIDVVALGSDYDGISRRLEMPDCSYMPLLEAELRRRKYSEEDIEKVFHKNALRVLREFI